MNPSIFYRAPTKKLLRHVLGVKLTTFKTYMKEIEPELLQEFPSYEKEKQCSILKPGVFKFLLKGYGLDNFEEINERINNYYRE